MQPSVTEMGQCLCIRVAFPTNRYHGREWPPSPARLFQALVAGALGGHPRETWGAYETALRALEKMPAPEILARRAEPEPEYRLSVPNNDSDKAAREWAAGRDYNPSALRTFKTIRPRRLTTDSEAIAHLIYLWPLDAAAPIHELTQLAHRLHTLGLGLDMAFAEAETLSDEEKLRTAQREGWLWAKPSAHGPVLPVPVPGCLEELKSRFAEQGSRQTKMGVNVAPPLRRFLPQPYSRCGEAYRSAARFELRKLDDSTAWHAVAWSRAPIVAAWVRHAAAEALREEGFGEKTINEYVLGHGAGHEHHLSFVPVPSVRRGSSDGDVRRVLIVEPRDSGGEVTDFLQTKLSPWVLMRLRENAPAARECEIQAAAPSDPVLSFYDRHSGRPSAVWQTVTPVVLHGHNTEHGKFSPKKTLQLIEAAFAREGFTAAQLSRLDYRPAPYWPGTGAALAIQVPLHLRSWPRYHVFVQFHKPIPGPLLVGIGQYYGLGLFAATE